MTMKETSLQPGDETYYTYASGEEPNYTYTATTEANDDNEPTVVLPEVENGYDSDFDILAEMKSSHYRGANECVTRLLEMAQDHKCRTKEILAHHLKAKAEIAALKFTDAMQSYEKAQEVARNSSNHTALALINVEFAALCASRLKFNLAHELLIEANRIYQELDLVDKKISSMMQLSSLYRALGNADSALKILNLAKNLHTALAECSTYSAKNNHFAVFKILDAGLAIKKADFKSALEKILLVLPTLDAEHHHDLFNYAQLKLGECYIGLSQREKSMNHLGLLKKIADADKEQTFILKLSVLKSVHEINFESAKLDWKPLGEKLASLWELGEVEFCLDHTLLILKRCDADGSISRQDAIIDQYQEWLNQLEKKIPHDLGHGFFSFYEYKPALTVKSSQNYQIKKLIEFGRDLICERNIDELCNKSLDLILEFTCLNRGFISLFESGHPRMASLRKFEGNDLMQSGSLDHASFKLAKAVLASGHPFIKSENAQSDLYGVAAGEMEVISAINQRTIVVLPLVVHGDGIGVIYLDGSTKAGSECVRETDTLESLASVIAFAVNNAFHFSVKSSDLKSIKKLISERDNAVNLHKNSFDSFIGISQKKTELFQTLQKTIDSNASILITGESGVGKEMVAKIIHYNGPRRDKEFVALNCAAIPENLLESELFGYTKGSFTGANENKDGLMVKATGGSLFLDEIGEMPLSMQVKILRAIQEREITPIGSSEPIKINIHLICATNKDLKQMVKAGTFREDLFFRINVVNVEVPPLRERKEDIPQLADHALRQYAMENGTPQRTLSTQAMHFIMHYPWPGNVRELINVMYNLSIFVDKPIIELNDLKERHELFRMPVDVKDIEDVADDDALNKLNERIDRQTITLSEAKQEFEKIQIQRALKLYNGQITSASYHLQMPRPQVSRLVKKYGLKNHHEAEHDDEET